MFLMFFVKIHQLAVAIEFHQHATGLYVPDWSVHHPNTIELFVDVA